MRKIAIIILIIVAVTTIMSSCSKQVICGENCSSKAEQVPGFDRLMIEECGRFKIIPSKGIAIDTALIKHQVKWRYSVYRLNADSTRYVMCR